MAHSYHHAYIASNVVAGLHKRKEYSVLSELALQIHKDCLLDLNIGLYPRQQVDFIAVDSVKITTMPLLAIEILSPTQGTEEVLEKFKVFFEAGVKSCWLIVPISRSIVVYSSMEKARIFNQDEEAHDNLIGVYLSLSEVFN